MGGLEKPVKNLNWKKTLNQQNPFINNIIKVNVTLSTM